MKVSVIVAAYNAEKYVTETMESLANQSIDDYEIIVVNDGSKDHTIDILRDYESRYDNITVVDKENGGPSSARNRGLDLAKGEYVYFFDADDVLELDALEALYERAKEKRADLVIAKYDIFNRSLIPALEKEGVHVLSHYENLSEKQSKYVDRYFTDEVYPVLTPMAVDSSRIRQSGRMATTPAMATRCFWPPDRLWGARSRYS